MSTLRNAVPLTAAERAHVAGLDEAGLIALRDDQAATLPIRACAVFALATLARQARGDTGFTFRHYDPTKQAALEALGAVVFADAMTPAAPVATMPRIERVAVVEVAQ